MVNMKTVLVHLHFKYNCVYLVYDYLQFFANVCVVVCNVQSSSADVSGTLKEAISYTIESDEGPQPIEAILIVASPPITASMEG